MDQPLAKVEGRVDRGGAGPFDSTQGWLDPPTHVLLPRPGYLRHQYGLVPIESDRYVRENRPGTTLSREMSVLGRKFIRIGILLLIVSAVAAARDVAVVSNKANSLQDVQFSELVKIGKGQTLRWPDGKPVTFVMMSPSAPDMKAVIQKMYESSATEVEGLISLANHERKNHPAIVVVDSPEAVVQKVESTPGAVGVVDVYSITSGVTVLKVDGKLPLQPGYALHGN